MNTSEQINEVATALAKAQAALRPATKDATNPAYRSKYADLTAVWEVCRVAFAPFGLSVVQDVTSGNGGVCVTTRIVHSSGQWIECGPLCVPLGKQDAHGVGSATSYGKRYALCAAVGIVADEDDDGNGAVESKPQPRGKREPQPESPVPRLITDAQRKHLADEAKRAGWDIAHVKGWLASMGYADSKQIPAANYDDILVAIQAGPAHAVANQMEAAVNAAQH